MIPPIYSPAAERYTDGMKYRRCGRSGILLPEVSLGLWHNFGAVDPLKRSFEIAHYAFDHGITHFDLANNYGPPYGSAEETFGTIMSYIPNSQFKCKVREGDGRCIITVENVKRVETALAFVEEIERHSIAPC